MVRGRFEGGSLRGRNVRASRECPP
jgi:hypothetical protein